MLLSKTDAEKIYKTWLSDKEINFNYKGEAFFLGWDKYGNICYLKEVEDLWVKLTNLEESHVELMRGSIKC